jgi:pyruvate dehydrogenase E2 component (dihydrolipoamide acetyltransferase)
MTTELKVPDIGDFAEVEVIELLVAAGDQVSLEQSLITVESDKASMEIPSPAAGRIVEMRVKIGDKVSKGSVLAMIEEAAGAASSAPAPSASPPSSSSPASPAAGEGTKPAAAGRTEAPTDGASQAQRSVGESQAAAGAQASQGAASTASTTPAPSIGDQRSHPVPEDLHTPASDGASKPHASPSVRKFARELGVDLAKVTGSGPKQRITHEDVQAWVKGTIARAESAQGAASGASGDGGAGLGLLPWPKVDFEKFGPVERKPVARIKKISAANLHRNWVMIPHVTNQDEADITDLEAFRVQLNQEGAKSGTKLTMLAFVIQACVHALKKFPEFNASLDGDTLVYKRYYHVGFAADTPNGLVVPVVRDADRKGLSDIAQETAELARKARDGKLSPTDMQGGTFSISSLGGIGGTGFTPIINAPEVAILGVSRSAMRPVWDGKQFAPRLVLPLSLSYDHRVIDGAAAARFNAHLVQLLGDFRRVSL